MNPEIIGIIASILTFACFVIRGEKRMRFVNIFGAGCFCVYGLMIGALSVWLLNGSLVILQIIYLIRDYIKEKNNE